MICGNCKRNCPAYGIECGGCPGCDRLLIECWRERGACRKCNLFCPDRPGAWRYVSEEIGGSFSLHSERPVVLPEVEVPLYMPLVTAPLQEKCPENGFEWFAVHGGKVRREVWSGEMSIYEQFRLPLDKKLVLYWFVKDRYLEKFWANRLAYIPVLKKLDAVFAPNFSVYENSPRIEHLINMKRAAIAIQEMAEAGVRVIPDVTWYRREDIDRWLEFLEAVGATVAAFSMQVVGHQKGCRAWLSYLAGLRYFARRFAGRIILIGTNSREKIAEAFRAAGRPLFIVDTKSFVTARRGGLVSSDGKVLQKKGGWGMSRDAAFFVSASNMESMISKFRGDGASV